MKLFTIIRDSAAAAGRAFVRLLGWLLRPLFGSISWNAPPWAQWLGGRAGALAVTVKARPLHALLALLVAVAIGAGGVWTWKWWQARPKPVEVAVSVENPARTPIENEDEADRGPRPLLVQYLPLYTPGQARRHEVRPGITGLAQVSGRNALCWEKKFELDVQYVDSLSFAGDLAILVKTVLHVVRRSGISAAGQATAAPFRGREATA